MVRLRAYQGIEKASYKVSIEDLPTESTAAALAESMGGWAFSVVLSQFQGCPHARRILIPAAPRYPDNRL